MRYEAPMLKCDGSDGWCDAIAPDFYMDAASTVGGVAITRTVRHPGWYSDDEGDFCPEHALAAPTEPEEKP